VDYIDGYPVAVASSDLIRVLTSPGLADSVANREITVLGIENRNTRAEIDGVEYPVRGLPVPVAQWTMPRVLIPETRASQFTDAETKPLALFTLERTLTDNERQKVWDGALEKTEGHLDLVFVRLFWCSEPDGKETHGRNCFNH
jgi:hypothetical protein